MLVYFVKQPFASCLLITVITNLPKPQLGIGQSQMHSLENLRGIPKDGSLDHQTITNWWDGFYNTNPNATMQEIFGFAKLMDDEFGHLFIPPVR